jgi:predicted metal-dependent hydrolase
MNSIVSVRRRCPAPIPAEKAFSISGAAQLKVKKQSGPEPSVKLIRGQICVETGSREAAAVRKCLAGWYRNRANDIFTRRLGEITERVGWLRQPPSWRLVRMKTQWGSCSPAGTILLNPHLVKAPRECIDYVISHELCHLREHNQSPRYYRLLSNLMPEWEPVKARLDEMAVLFLNE